MRYIKTGAALGRAHTFRICSLNVPGLFQQDPWITPWEMSKKLHLTLCETIIPGSPPPPPIQICTKIQWLLPWPLTASSTRFHANPSGRFCIILLGNQTNGTRGGNITSSTRLRQWSLFALVSNSCHVCLLMSPGSWERTVGYHASPLSLKTNNPASNVCPSAALLCIDGARRLRWWHAQVNLAGPCCGGTRWRGRI